MHKRTLESRLGRAHNHSDSVFQRSFANRQLATMYCHIVDFSQNCGLVSKASLLFILALPSGVAKVVSRVGAVETALAFNQYGPGSIS